MSRSAARGAQAGLISLADDEGAVHVPNSGPSRSRGTRRVRHRAPCGLRASRDRDDHTTAVQIEFPADPRCRSSGPTARNGAASIIRVRDSAPCRRDTERQHLATSG